MKPKFAVSDILPKDIHNDFASLQKEDNFSLPASPSSLSYSSYLREFSKSQNQNFKKKKQKRENESIIKDSKKKKQKNFGATFTKQISLLKNFQKNENNKPIRKAFYNLISKFYLAKKFINILKNITSRRLPKFLSKFHFQIINDVSFFYEFWKQEEKMKNEIHSDNNKKNFIFKFAEILIQTYRKAIQNFQVFDNSSKFEISWNIMHLIFIVFYFIIIPLEITFEIKLHVEISIFNNFEYFSIFFFLLDILINCNTAVYLKGRLEKNRKKIIQNYFKKSFVYDILSLFSVIIHVIILELNNLSHHELISSLQILFFLRMKNFSNIIKKLEEMIFIDQSIYNILSLIKLIFRIIFVSHIFACLWYYVGTIYENPSWISSCDLTSEPWWSKYLYSYYFVSITMNTVGYGDITPKNQLEFFFVIISYM